MTSEDASLETPTNGPHLRPRTRVWGTRRLLSILGIVVLVVGAGSLFDAAQQAPSDTPVKDGAVAEPQEEPGNVVGTECIATHDGSKRQAHPVDGAEGTVPCPGASTPAPSLAAAPPEPTSSASAVQPVTQPTAQPSAPPASLLNTTILCYYGNRAAGSMGILGRHSLEQLEHKLRELSAVYDELNGERSVTPCFDYIYLVANPSVHPYSHYTPLMDLFEEALAFAEERNILFFIDLQPGYRDLGRELDRLLPYLLKSNVHVALDSEFFMHRRGGVPGDTLGSMDAADVNRVIGILERIVQDHNLPPKILKVYQFDPIMLTNKDQLRVDSPQVQLLINADGVGYGGIEGKIADYQEYAGEPHNGLGMKLFLEWDTPVLTPEEVMALEPQPAEVMYQ